MTPTYEEKICHCGHIESKHIGKWVGEGKGAARISDNKRCTEKGCKCMDFVAMDQADLDLINSLEE